MKAQKSRDSANPHRPALFLSTGMKRPRRKLFVCGLRFRSGFGFRSGSGFRLCFCLRLSFGGSFRFFLSGCGFGFGGFGTEGRNGFEIGFSETGTESMVAFPPAVVARLKFPSSSVETT